jgi:acetyltransferase-like isoleucine patch superfamily enzyme
MDKRETWRRGEGIIFRNSSIEEGTSVWHYANIFDSTIGRNCVIGSHTEIGGAKIGNKCKIQSGVFICEGVTLEDEVFVGPNVVFTNDRFPKAVPCLEHCEGNRGWICTPTLVKKGASIGANSTIRCGVVIGEDATIGCGSTVTKNVPVGETWCGNPAKRIKRNILKRIKISFTMFTKHFVQLDS